MATDLNEALRTVGPNVLDGTPLRGESGANRCPVPDCDLPGGHDGHHQDRDGQTFMYDLYEGKKAPVEAADGEESESSSSSSSSARSDPSEELMLVEKKPNRRSRRAAVEKPKEEETFVSFTLEVDEKDFEWLAKNKESCCLTSGVRFCIWGSGLGWPGRAALAVHSKLALGRLCGSRMIIGQIRVK